MVVGVCGLLPCVVLVCAVGFIDIDCDHTWVCLMSVLLWVSVFAGLDYWTGLLLQCNADTIHTLLLPSDLSGDENIISLATGTVRQHLVY